MEQTMTKQKLTNEEIERVLCLYYGCALYRAGQTNATVYSENLAYIDEFNLWNEVKLLLTPLSSISDEHAIEVAKIFNEHKIKAHYNCEDLHDYLILKGKSYSARCEHYTSVFQYLISKGYAVPLFFSVNHWANGKTAIELNIAIAS